MCWSDNWIITLKTLYYIIFYSDIIRDIVRSTWREFLCPVPNNSMACFGDSGGALICQGNLFGIISHGYNYYPGMSELSTICGDIRVQTRHIFVYKYRQWIDNIMYANTSNTIKRNYLLFFYMVWCLVLQSSSRKYVWK